MIRRYNHHDFVVSYPVNPLRTSRFFAYPSVIQTVKPSTDPNFQHRVHSSPPLDLPETGKSSPQPHARLSKIFLSISFDHLRTCNSTYLFSESFPIKTLHAFHIFPIRTACSAYLSIRFGSSNALWSLHKGTNHCATAFYYYLLPLSHWATTCTTFSNTLINVLAQQRFFLLHSMHADNKYHPTSYSVGTGDIATEMRSWLLTST